MIIDCHGHYTTTPPGVGRWREAQKAAVSADPDHVGSRGQMAVTDDEIRDSLESAQLAFQRERGIDLTIFSPRASWMAHHIGNEHTSKFWSQHQNELIRRVCDLYPRNFAPSAQLPQSPGAPIDGSVAELRRCVEQMGFVGCNVNPDPSGGHWSGPPLWDRHWWPLWEAMCELDVPGMIHVSASCNDNFWSTGSHYLGADTTAFMQALSSGFLDDFDGLRLVIPHGGGAVPYHWGRFRGMAQDAGWDFDSLLDHVWFDTCVYHQRGIDLLVDVVPVDNILFASEMVGAVRGVDPATGHHYDDTGRYLNAAALSDAERSQIFEGNARRVYPRLRIDASAPPAIDASAGPGIGASVPLAGGGGRRRADERGRAGGMSRDRSVVVRNIERADPAVIGALAPIGTATVHEATGRRGYAGPDIRPIQRGARVAGSAVTVLSHPGDNLMVHAAVDVCRPGDILVVTNTAPSTHGMFGDLLATSLAARGVTALVVDAGVRDTADLRAMGFPAWSRHVSCEGTVKATPGSVNVPVVLGSQAVKPGDVICADDDGVVVVARAEAAQALEDSRRRLARERETRARLASGELGLDVYGMRDQLADLGVVYVDNIAGADSIAGADGPEGGNPS